MCGENNNNNNNNNSVECNEPFGCLSREQRTNLRFKLAYIEHKMNSKHNNFKLLKISYILVIILWVILVVLMIILLIEIIL
jgi:hypothetical protein